ncbi:MAG: Gfo/Idh/MocA family oxidoreductase [Caldilineaceae bacterium]|nr:Gfo/Idh/MocA family oxidoreductase [Caldilineaceae bacterium]
MTRPIRMAFVGLGSCLQTMFGPVLRLAEGLEVVAVVDSSAERLVEAREMYGLDNGYLSLDECLEKEELDAALIGTPVFEHVGHAVACAERGVHVLLEKPMARSPRECDEIIDAHAKAGTVLMMAFMKRFNRSMRKVTELIEGGAIGAVMGIRHNWDWGPDESGWVDPGWRGSVRTWGGQWQDHGSHSVNLSQWWAGPIRSVTAFFDITGPYPEVENDYIVVCTHESGARSTHAATRYFHRRGEERYLVFGETGTVETRHEADVFRYTTPHEIRLHRYGRVEENHRPKHSRNWQVESEQYSQYKVELEHFVACVRHGKTPMTDGAMGRAAVEVTSAAYLSALERREVTLPLTKEPDYEYFFRNVAPQRTPARYAGQVRT